VPIHSQPDSANLAGAKKIISGACQERISTMISCGLAIGWYAGYIHGYLFKGSPKRLDGDARAILAEIMRIDPDQLRDLPPRTLPIGRHVSGKSASTVADTHISVPIFLESDVIDLVVTRNKVVPPACNPSIVIDRL
jgi:hypothetical protein